jgi:predicted Zn-dependent protease
MRQSGKNMILRAWFRANWRVPVVAALFAAAGVTVSLAAPEDSVSELKAAVAALQANQASSALATLRPLAKKLPKLADYIAWFTATAEFNLENYTSVPTMLEPVWAQTPPSPLVGRSALLSSQALQKSGNTQDALNVLRKYYASLAQPQGDLAMAKAFLANGDAISAAI